MIKYYPKLRGIGKTVYHETLKTSTKGTVILLKRNPNECCVNNYNLTCLQGWNANTDILNAYACIMYIASYMVKAEESMAIETSS